MTEHRPPPPHVQGQAEVRGDYAPVPTLDASAKGPQVECAWVTISVRNAAVLLLMTAFVSLALAARSSCGRPAPDAQRPNASALRSAADTPHRRAHYSCGSGGSMAGGASAIS